MPNVNFSRREARTSASQPHLINTTRRVRIVFSFLLVLSAVFIVRLFYLQVIRHDYYRKLALESQLKQYQVPAERGVIRAYDGSETVPLVLNEKKFTLFADPKFIKDPAKEAAAVVAIVGGDVNKMIDQLKTKDSRYVILAKKLSKEQSEKIEKLAFLGIGTREESYRTYPEGSLASQVLGFVNDDGQGQYGLEQFMDERLKGVPGELRAITDVAGVPLVSSHDNIVTDPKPGEQVLLTIDVGMQRQLEDLLKTGLDRAKSSSGSALIMDVKTGALKAVANYPTFDPSAVSAVTDLSTLSNAAVGAALEVGSIMKPLTAAAALNLGVINPDSTYYDHSRIKIDDATVSNIEEDGGPGTKSIRDILQLSINTGAVYLLQQMGGGEINEKARLAWYDYLTNHYGLGSPTGVEQVGEGSGIISEPNVGYGRNIQYANMSFGQGMSATILQMAAALSSIVNGGKYYQPHLVDATTDGAGVTTKNQPKLVRTSVTPKTSQDMVGILEYVFEKNHLLYGMPNPKAGYSIGGKTGTAQIPNPTGGYYEDKYNGLFSGFVGGAAPEYVILVRVNEPKIAGYAGAKAAAPIFSSIVNMLIDSFGLSPRKV